MASACEWLLGCSTGRGDSSGSGIELARPPSDEPSVTGGGVDVFAVAEHEGNARYTLVDLAIDEGIGTLARRCQMSEGHMTDTSRATTTEDGRTANRVHPSPVTREAHASRDRHEASIRGGLRDDGDRRSREAGRTATSVLKDHEGERSSYIGGHCAPSTSWGHIRRCR
jgi:hypothetical protein